MIYYRKIIKILNAKYFIQQRNIISYFRFLDKKYDVNYISNTSRSKVTTEPKSFPSSSFSSSSSKKSKLSEPQLHPYRNQIIYSSLTVLCIFSGTLVYYILKSKDQHEAKVTNIGKPNVGGPWSLVDHNGVPRTSADYTGKFKLLYFGFAHCPDICPNELVKMGKVMEELGK